MWQFVRKMASPLAVVLVVAGCANGKEDAPQPNVVKRQVTVLATVFTDESGCKDQTQERNDKTVPGFCWLPLYSNLDLLGPALNEGDENSSCYADGATNRGCWPQPNTQLEVVCTIVYKGNTLLGVKVPGKQVLSPPKPDETDKTTIGFVKAQYLRFAKAVALADLAECPSP